MIENNKKFWLIESSIRYKKIKKMEIVKTSI